MIGRLWRRLRWIVTGLLFAWAAVQAYDALTLYLVRRLVRETVRPNWTAGWEPAGPVYVAPDGERYEAAW